LLGLAAFGFLADGFGRKPITLTFFATAFAMTWVMFSIDYPYQSNDVGKRFLDSLPLAPADVERIVHVNADRLLRLKQ
jgi:predicted TIM-barrel fold metal-dependent hydrolase